ncbi:MAG TPA: hypothetical protein VE870_01595, partial [Bacteroidales bacterium]|nr:hypothetical protein [Bacteroidales bacterium]
LANNLARIEKTRCPGGSTRKKCTSYPRNPEGIELLHPFRVVRVTCQPYMVIMVFELFIVGKQSCKD